MAFGIDDAQDTGPKTMEEMRAHVGSILSSEDRGKLHRAGLVGALGLSKRDNDFIAYLYDRPDELTKYREFLDAYPTLVKGDLGAAYSTWSQETPLRQQERQASATIDLGMENTPEVIAGGTARTQRTGTQRRRIGGNSTLDLATSLGIMSDSGVSTDLGII